MYGDMLHGERLTCSVERKDGRLVNDKLGLKVSALRFGSAQLKC